jgi:hypothetical protein
LVCNPQNASERNASPHAACDACRTAQRPQTGGRWGRKSHNSRVAGAGRSPSVKGTVEKRPLHIEDVSMATGLYGHSIRIVPHGRFNHLATDSRSECICHDNEVGTWKE